MKIAEAMEKISNGFGTTFYADVDANEKATKEKNIDKRWGPLLRRGTPMEITLAVNQVPRIDIGTLLYKLQKSRYKKYPGTEIAISKLKWRRGY